MQIGKDPWSPERQRSRLSLKLGSTRRLTWLLISVVLAGFSLLTAGYLSTLNFVSIIDGAAVITTRTRQPTVETVLREAGIQLMSEDVISPSLPSPISNNSTIVLQRAKLVLVNVDNRESRLIRTHSRTADDVLRSLGYQVGHHDVLMVDGRFTSALPDALANQSASDIVSTISYRRASQFIVQDENNPPITLYTTASTVGEAVMQTGYIVFLADSVTPALGDEVKPGITIRIVRSKPVSILVDGRRLRTRTRSALVSDVLNEMKIVLFGQDYTVPALDTGVAPDTEIRVVRVRKDVVINQDVIPYETFWQADPDLELDTQALGQEGAPGVREHRTLVTYEDSAEVKRQEIADFIAREPEPRIYKYGTKVVIREMQTPNGTVQYWRTMRMLATSYSASTAGVSLNKPYYGRTRCGTQMQGGIVAVDPGVISLRTYVYVEGYGMGYACDTGNAIVGKRIDLGFDEGKLELWYRWTKVYLLTPVTSNITYRLD